MEIILTVISLVLVATSIFFFRLNKNSQNLQSENLVSDERVKNLLAQLQEQNKKFELSLEENRQLSSFKGKYEHAQSEINFLREEKNKLSEESNALRHKILEFEKRNELLKQTAQELQNQKEEWNKNKETMLFQLSEELIKKNNEQQNLLSINQQENIKKITENLFKDFESVTAKVMALKDEVKKSADESASVKNALLSPGSSGRTA
jgi:DNA anti-recombination protein RmuC